MIYIRDVGNGFNPYRVLNPRNLENVELANGKGLMLIGNYMSTREHHAINGNTIYLPLHDSSDDNLLTRELVLQIPARGSPDELVKAFRSFYDNYAADTTSE